jgi:hypothetical protein
VENYNHRRESCTVGRPYKPDPAFEEANLKVRAWALRVFICVPYTIVEPSCVCPTWDEHDNRGITAICRSLRRLSDPLCQLVTVRRVYEGRRYLTQLKGILFLCDKASLPSGLSGDVHAAILK